MPDLPRPKTATFFPEKTLTGVIASSSISPQFQRREPDQREYDGNDPETNHDLRLGPALLLEMVMDRRHLEDALSRELERSHLHDHRNRFQHEQTPDHREDDLVLGRDRDGAEKAAERERAGIAHEDRGGRGVEPQKSEARAEHGAADDREFARSRDMPKLEIFGEDQVAGEIRDDRERKRGDHHRHDREPVEPVGEVHGVARAHNHEGAEDEEEIAEVEDIELDQREG